MSNTISSDFDCIVDLVDSSWVEVERIYLEVVVVLYDEEQTVEISLLVTISPRLALVAGNSCKCFKLRNELVTLYVPHQPAVALLQINTNLYDLAAIDIVETNEQTSPEQLETVVAALG